MSSLDSFRVEHLDGEQILLPAAMPLEDAEELVYSLDEQMKEIDIQLAKWWAVIEYAKLGT